MKNISMINQLNKLSYSKVSNIKLVMMAGMNTDGSQEFLETTEDPIAKGSKSKKKGSRSNKRKRKPSNGSGISDFKTANNAAWDSAMSKLPDMSNNACPGFRHREPSLVDQKTGVITPSLLLRFVNVFPTGIKHSIFHDFWFNNQFHGKLELMARCYNGSDSKITKNYLSNYFRGVGDMISIYIYLNSISVLCTQRIRGEFDSDLKFKSSVGVINDYYRPLSARFREELRLFKEALDNYFLPQEMFSLYEETYSPKFSTFAGVRTVELTSIVFPVHRNLLAYSEMDDVFDPDEYCLEDKEMVSLFIDEIFWKEFQRGKEKDVKIPRRSYDRILNFIRNLRISLDANRIEERGEFTQLHEILRAVVPEYSLLNKLSDAYGVIALSPGNRFSRVNGAQNEICKSYYSQAEISPVYTVYRANANKRIEWFGSVNFGVYDLPLVEKTSTYTDDGSSGRTIQGGTSALIFDQFEAYHTERGGELKIQAMELLKAQLGFEFRTSQLETDENRNSFKKNVIQPGVMVQIPDHNGGSWTYTIESSHTNVLLNIVNYKPEQAKWFTSFEQPKFTKLSIPEGVEINGSKLVDTDGSVKSGVDVEPDIIGTSGIVACYFDINTVKVELRNLVSEIWRSDTLIKRLVDHPNGPADNYAIEVNR